MSQRRRLLGGIVLAAIMVGTFVVSYAALSYTMFTGVWGDPVRGRGQDPLAIVALTEPVHGRLAQAYDNAVHAARRAGYYPTQVQVRQTSHAFDLSWMRWYATHYAEFAWENNTITVDTVWTQTMTDDQLVCLFSHELGHVLQRDQAVEFDDEIPLPVRRFILEQDADTTARIICGAKTWDSFFATYVGTRNARNE